MKQRRERPAGGGLGERRRHAGSRYTDTCDGDSAVNGEPAQSAFRPSSPNPATRSALPDLDVDANELTLVYRARGMSPEEAEAHAHEVLGSLQAYTSGSPVVGADGEADAGASIDARADVPDEHEAIGNGWSAALSSFCFFACGAIIPILPYLFGLGGTAAMIRLQTTVAAASPTDISGPAPCRMADARSWTAARSMRRLSNQATVGGAGRRLVGLRPEMEGRSRSYGGDGIEGLSRRL